jgi:hypothetical protein
MNRVWDERGFEDFIMLRDKLRLAKREKKYQDVIDLGIKIVEIDEYSKTLKICTPIFYKDIGEAGLKLGDTELALKYFILAKNGFLEYRISDFEWQKDIDVLDKKIEKLQK